MAFLLLAHRGRVRLIAIALFSLATACSESSSRNSPASTANPQQDLRPFPGVQEDINRRVDDRVFFAVDSAKLDTAAKKEVFVWIDFLKKYPARSLLIEGHCDERGTRDYNLALGQRRAESVKNYLIANGVDASRLRTLSYGKERPAVLGS